MSEVYHDGLKKMRPKQLQLESEKSRRFYGAVIEITPRKGRILIRAEIRAYVLLEEIAEAALDGKRKEHMELAHISHSLAEEK